MIVAMLGQSQPTTAPTTKITRKNKVRLAFTFTPCHRSAKRRWGSFFFRLHLSAQRKKQRHCREHEDHDHSRPAQPAIAVARHRTVEIFLHQIAQYQTENHRWPRITGTAHEITQDAEPDHDHKIQGIAVDAESAEENEDEHDRNHERVAHLGELGELGSQYEPNQCASDSRDALNPDHAKD